MCCCAASSTQHSSVELRPSKSGSSKTFDSHASGFILHTHKHLDCTYFPDGKASEVEKRAKVSASCTPLSFDISSANAHSNNMTKNDATTDAF